MELIDRMTSSRARSRYEQVFLVLVALALTLPFADQAVHIDAHLTIDWARQAFDHPLWHHIPDYDYFGIHYDEFHDTKPRLFSLFLALVIKLAGGVSAPAMHLAMIPFQVIAVLAMYRLSRRFGVNALAATLLMLLSPAFLVNSHLIMTDVPGLSLWLAGLALFIAGADRDRLVPMLLSSLPFTAAIFIYYQGFAVIPLALAYLVIKRKVNKKTVMSLSIPVILFIAFVSAHMGRYASLPTVTYPVFGLPLDIRSVLWRIRGVVTLTGAAVIFPLLGVWLFPRSRLSRIATAGTLAVAVVWTAVLCITGGMPLEALLLLPLFLASGVAIIWLFAGLFIRNLWPVIRKRPGGDSLWLSLWFIGILFYCAILLPYPSPRYLLPMVPPVIILTVKLVEERWGGAHGKMSSAMTWIAAATFILSMLIAVSEHQRANTNRAAADWAAVRYGNAPGTVWFNGGLGFQYYMEQKGFRMLLTDSEEPEPGDLIVESVNSGRWPLGEELADRVELVHTHDFERSWPVTTENIVHRTSWIGILDVVLPYGVSGDYVDRIYVYEVLRAPGESAEEGDEHWPAKLPGRIVEGLSAGP